MTIVLASSFMAIAEKPDVPQIVAFKCTGGGKKRNMVQEKRGGKDFEEMVVCTTTTARALLATPVREWEKAQGYQGQPRPNRRVMASLTVKRKKNNRLTLSDHSKHD